VISADLDLQVEGNIETRLALCARAVLISTAHAHGVACLCDSLLLLRVDGYSAKDAKSRERYQGNLRYYNKSTFGGRRVSSSVFAICAGLAAIIVYQRRMKRFSIRKLSASHAALADGCASCHDKASLSSALTSSDSEFAKRSISSRRLL
jgi:hypothetical protein